MSMEPPKGRHFDSLTPLAGGLIGELNNGVPLSENRGRGWRLTCPVCGIAFTKPDAWVKRTKGTPCCSVACAGVFKRTRVQKECVVCHSVFLVTPSTRIVTCSKQCSRRRRMNGDQYSKGQRLAPEIYVARQEVLARGCACGARATRVCGMVAYMTKEGARIDVSNAFASCDSCHGARAAAAREEKRAVEGAATEIAN